jgi:hypothetical protein
MSQNGSSVPEFMSTHPSDATRVNNITKELPEALEVYKGVWGNYPSGNTPANNTNTDTTKKSGDWHF